MGNRIMAIFRKQGVQYSLLSAAASAVNMLTLILFGRVFPVEEYGRISTIQALVANIAVLMTPLQIMLCRLIAGGERTEERSRSDLIRLAFLLNGAELAVMLAAIFPLMRYLHLSEILDGVLFALLVLANNAYLVVNGEAQGYSRFLKMGWAALALYGVKMTLSLLLAWAGLQERAVLLGFVAGEAAALIILLHRTGKESERSGLRNLLPKGEKNAFLPERAVVREYLRLTFVYLVVSLYMNNGDLLLANLYIPEEAIGLYSVAMTLSKLSVFLIATPLATMLLPRAAAKREDRAGRRKDLLVAEGISVLLSALCGAALTLLAGWMIGILYGTDYAEAAVYMGACAIFAVVLGGFWIFYQYAMATELETSFTVSCIVFGGIAVAAVLLMHPAIGTIPLILSVCMGLTVAATLLAGRRGLTKQER